MLLSIRNKLAELADPERAPDMQRYMKSEMPFHGVPAQARRTVCKKIFKNFAPWDSAKWRDSILELWRGAEYREERYAALDLIDWKPCRPFHVWDAVPLLEELIITGAWWDYCDSMTGILGNILRSDPNRMRKLMLAWSCDDNIWKRRSSILCQLRFKEDLDFEFLQRCIEPSLESGEFFLRKGIGWALRDYAWTRPQLVKDYVEKNSDRLSALSRREALKNMHKLL